MKNKNFKLFCKELDEILSVKSYSHTEEGLLYDKLKDFLSSVPSSFNVIEYKKKVVDSLLLDASSYYSFLDNEVDSCLSTEIVTALYNTIIEAYPHFEFEFICNDINNTIAFDQMRNIFKSQISKLVEESPQTSKKRKIKSFSDIMKLSQRLNKEVIGQEEAAEKTVDAIKLIVADIDSFSSLFYIGPTGVGKTKLAKMLGKSYSGNFFKVNCGEYGSPHDYAKLIGAPPGYVGHSDTSLLGDKAAESNAWIILFDEIEKANSKFYDFLLSLLDDGTCTDNMGNVLDFSKSLFIFTTNAGVQENRLGDRRMGFGQDDITYEENRDQITTTIKKTFTAEFLNRIDHFVFFNRLNEPSLRKIAKLEMAHLPVVKSKSLLDFVINNSNHHEYGARNIAKFIKNNIATKVADAILRKQLPLGKGRYYTFKVDKNNLYISNIEEEDDGRKNQKTSESS
jgi:ATP-dependent Clp protease ATP-binding subunit ClpA